MPWSSWGTDGLGETRLMVLASLMEIRVTTVDPDFHQFADHARFMAGGWMVELDYPTYGKKKPSKTPRALVARMFVARGLQWMRDPDHVTTVEGAAAEIKAMFTDRVLRIFSLKYRDMYQHHYASTLHLFG